jgi:hypothetical protein
MSILKSNPKSTNELYRKLLIDSVRRIGSISLLTCGLPAFSKTYFDTDVYGDKELKIATVNKLKQKLRNAILNDITLAPGMIKLAINDALDYDYLTQDGGPDGSILFEMDRVENKDLVNVVNVLLGIKKELQRTNTVSFADIVAFGGAEALETVGCGRIIVQVGRFDAKSGINSKQNIVSWDSPNLENILNAFKKSGLSAKEVALLIGALGEVRRIVDETTENNEITNGNNEDEEADDEFEKQPFVPQTFGSRDAIYGSKMGKGDFSNKYLLNVLKGKYVLEAQLGSILLENPEVKSYVVKYAGNNSAFLTDLPEAYLKLTLLGESYTTRNS